MQKSNFLVIEENVLFQLKRSNIGYEETYLNYTIGHNKTPVEGGFMVNNNNHVNITITIDIPQSHALIHYHHSFLCAFQSPGMMRFVRVFLELLSCHQVMTSKVCQQLYKRRRYDYNTPRKLPLFR